MKVSEQLAPEFLFGMKQIDYNGNESVEDAVSLCLYRVLKYGFALTYVCVPLPQLAPILTTH